MIILTKTSHTCEAAGLYLSDNIQFNNIEIC